MNLDKTNVCFSKGVKSDRRARITQLLDIREILLYDKYLGLPTFVGRSRQKPFLFIVDRIKKRLSGSMDRLVSWAGREVLIKAVAQAIPTYAMSVFKLPTNLCHMIQSTINRFWWGYSTEKKKIHWVRSEVLCKAKTMGGLGFREMAAFNDALLAKQFWRLAKFENTLVASLLKARYFPHGNIFEAELGLYPSFTWRSILGARDLVVKGSRWLVGDGSTLNIWDSRWLPRPTSFAPYTPKPPEGSISKVSDLIDYERGAWKRSFNSGVVFTR